MRSKWVVVSLLIVGVITSSWLLSRGQAADTRPPASRATRQNVELTVYLRDFGMVREMRPMQLTAGSNRLRVIDVSKQLDPRSVLLRWQSDAPDRPQLVAHSYDLGVTDSAGLLQRYLGKNGSGYHAAARLPRLASASDPQIEEEVRVLKAEAIGDSHIYPVKSPTITTTIRS
jgi:hypothetical protein